MPLHLFEKILGGRRIAARGADIPPSPASPWETPYGKL